jgi:hypothetical protein
MVMMVEESRRKTEDGITVLVEVGRWADFEGARISVYAYVDERVCFNSSVHRYKWLGLFRKPAHEFEEEIRSSVGQLLHRMRERRREQREYRDIVHRVTEEVAE